VIVDENGLPELPEPGRHRLTTDPVTFLYTGGSEPLKGVHVVLEAARQLRDLEGWTLHAYGIEAYLDEHGLHLPAAVSARPRFSPDEADAVFDAADVLILPSVVRESHSLVTREALSRGMPVITTDTLGPEEVVVDRENGFVVPAGDAEALAEAMRRLVADRMLRRRVGEGARRGVRIRPLEDQIAGLDRRFVEIGSAPRAVRAAPLRPVRRVLFMAGIDGAPLRYRAHFAAEALELVGVHSWVRHYRSPENAALAGLADAVVVYRVPATRQVLALIDATQARGVPVFYDVDDLVFDPDIAATIPAVQALPADERRLYFEGVHRYRTTLEACDAFVGTTEMLVDHVRSVAGLPAHRWWNGVGIGPARCSDAALAQRRTPGPLRIGYMSGTKTHDDDWRFVEPAIVEVLRSRPDVELWLGGLVTPTAALDPFGSRIKRIDMKPWWELPWVLRDLDVNLAPLAPGSSFNEAKSAIKWLEAALTETPTVATPTQPFRECITAGVNGELAETVEQFAEKVGGLLDDRLARVRMGKLARRAALLRWSPHLQGERYLDILQNAAVGRDSPSSWTSAVALDEPWADIPAEGYIVPDPMILGPTERDFDDGEPADAPTPAPASISGLAARARDRAHRDRATPRRAAGGVARRARPRT
jgi:glycosyltransferase involved in cell wall biosynthesis